MSEYIIDWDENLVIDTFSKNSLREEIVRCRDCKHCNKREFLPDECVRDGYLFDVEPDGFCKWGEGRDE